MPGAATSLWMGILAWSAVGDLLPVWAWLLAGLGGVASAVPLAPGIREGQDPIRAAGLVDGDKEPASLGAVAPGRARWGRAPPAGVAVVAALGVFLLGVGWGGVHAHRVEGSLLRRLAPGRVVVEATLRTDPSPGTFGWFAIADVSVVEWEGGSAAVRESVWVHGGDEPPMAVRGDRVRLDGELGTPDDPGFAESLRRRGMTVELRARAFERLGGSSNPFVRAAQACRAVVGRSIRRLFPPREAGLLLGLALGDDSGLDPGVERDFRATGLGHLLVVSGGNVAMVVGPVLALAVLLRLSLALRCALGLGTVAFFVVLTGAEPSVMRAGVMAGLALFGMLLGRPRSAASILAGAVLVLLVLDPTLVWAIGFQLSVTATAGMVAMASPIAERLWFLPRPVALAAGATLAAQAGVTPVLLFHFHEVPGVTLIANVLAFPAVSPAMLLGLAAAAAGIVIDVLGRVLAAAALAPIRYLELVADRLATAPVPWITSRGALVPLVAGLVFVCVAAWWLRSGRRLQGRVLAAGLVLLPILIWSTALSAGPPSGLVVRFLDVGQGDAALVSSPAGATVLIDAGPEPETVAMKLSALGVKRVDAVVATHPHADHVAGFPAVFARFPVGLVLEPGCHEASPSYEDFLHAVTDEDLPVEHPRAGDRIVVGDLTLDILAPEGCFNGTDSDPNNDSLVIRLVWREDAVLFSGDAEEPSQQAVMDEGAPLHADVLKVPHHGGDTSLEGFFEAVGPELAVVSVGPNDYGHPVPEVLEELSATGARVLRTDRAGDITVTFTPGGLLVESTE